MGGSALKIETRRVESSREFYDLVREVTNILTQQLEWHVASIRWYRQKESFGDMDILVNSNSIGENWVETVLETFQPNDHFKNGPCLSFDYKGVQVDLILAQSNSFDFSYNYFSWNDLGNFIGRTAYRLGFKFGHDGLWYVLRDPEDNTHVIKEILISRDFDRVVKFLGYRAAPFHVGFDTPEQIYEFVTTSMHFDPRQFFLVNRSYAARVRDKKRKMYTGMLEYIRLKYPDIGEESVPLPIDRNEHLIRAFAWFPDFKAQYDDAIAEFKLNQEFKKKFNGLVIGSLFGLEGKALGECMSALRWKIDKYDLRQFVIDLNERQAKEFFIILDED